MATTPAEADRISLVLWKRTMTRTNEAFSRPTFATSSCHSFWSLRITSNPNQNHPQVDPIPRSDVTAPARRDVGPRRVDVGFVKRREPEIVQVQSPPEKSPHHGRYPGKRGEGQEACIVHRVGPAAGDNTASTPASLAEGPTLKSRTVC